MNAKICETVITHLITMCSIPSAEPKQIILSDAEEVTGFLTSGYTRGQIEDSTVVRILRKGGR